MYTKEPTQTQQDMPNKGKNAPNNEDSALQEAKDKYLRLYAEFENFRKRTRQEKSSLLERGRLEIIQKLLPIVDDFERALDKPTDNPSEDGWTGIGLIYEKLLQLLQQENVQPVTMEKGTEFDSDLHEAVSMVSTEETDMHGKVTDVVTKGYQYKGQIIRFAKVIIGAP